MTWITQIHATTKPPKVTPPSNKPPMIARFKNHEAAAKKAIRREDSPTKIEWCSQCFAPVSNWLEHTERVGCKKQ